MSGGLLTFSKPDASIFILQYNKITHWRRLRRLTAAFWRAGPKARLTCSGRFTRSPHLREEADAVQRGSRQSATARSNGRADGSARAGAVPVAQPRPGAGGSPPPAPRGGGDADARGPREALRFRHAAPASRRPSPCNAPSSWGPSSWPPSSWACRARPSCPRTAQPGRTRQAPLPAASPSVAGPGMKSAPWTARPGQGRRPISALRPGHGDRS